MTVTPPEYGGCPWPIDPACAGDDWDNLAAEQKDRALALASSTLTRLTGGRVSECPITVRPCKATEGQRSMLSPYLGRSMFNPQIDRNGFWVNACGHVGGCSCTVLCEVRLPRPVGRVDEVKVDGQVISPTDYYVADARLIWAGAGECPWSACQDLNRSDSEPNTFSVTYLNSYPVDSMGACAVATLAMEFGRAMRGNKCRLPSGVTNIVRQGVSMEIAGGTFPNGVTGIREVDAYIALWNPDGLKRQASVWSPDVRRHQIGGPM